MSLQFREITLADKPQVEACAAKYNYHLCEYCFTDLFIWRGHYCSEICFYDGFLLIRTEGWNGGDKVYLAPIGDGDLKAALMALEQDAKENNMPFRMISVTEGMIDRIEAVLPGRYEFSHPDEDGDDYIYLREKLQTLSGKKLQSKRNLVNRFQAQYEGRWRYEPLTPQNADEAYQFHLHWCKENGCEHNSDFEGETCAIKIGLEHIEELGLMGGLLYLDEKVIAFTFGSTLCDDTIVVQIEKAEHTIQGAYQMINQQFVLRNGGDVTYINREEDLGIEGLRKAKHSYYPVMRGVKYRAKVREGQA